MDAGLSGTFSRTLHEEEAANKKLTTLAKSINVEVVG
jgi:hypothetical protein